MAPDDGDDDDGNNPFEQQCLTTKFTTTSPIFIVLHFLPILLSVVTVYTQVKIDENGFVKYSIVTLNGEQVEDVVRNSKALFYHKIILFVL